MFDFTLRRMRKGEYDHPIDDAPSWRGACETGLNTFGLEENPRLIGRGRLIKHDRALSELLRFEAFMATIQRGWDFIPSQHGNSR
jgi:hypothetical protein